MEKSLSVKINFKTRAKIRKNYQNTGKKRTQAVYILKSRFDSNFSLANFTGSFHFNSQVL